MPCSEGCEECEDDSPCVYKVKITLRVILITIDGVAALLALVIGALVLIYRESKVILFVEIASVVLYCRTGGLAGERERNGKHDYGARPRVRDNSYFAL